MRTQHQQRRVTFPPPSIIPAAPFSHLLLPLLEPLRQRPAGAATYGRDADQLAQGHTLQSTSTEAMAGFALYYCLSL
jgi:hypothetical protein